MYFTEIVLTSVGSHLDWILNALHLITIENYNWDFCFLIESHNLPILKNRLFWKCNLKQLT